MPAGSKQRAAMSAIPPPLIPFLAITLGVEFIVRIGMVPSYL